MLLPTNCRLVCKSDKLLTAALCDMEARPKGFLCGCVIYQLGPVYSWICFSSILFNYQMKIVHEKATVKMIVPMWTTQVWFTGVLNLLIELPRIFHVSNEVLSNPLLPPGPHPLHPKLYLMACKSSGVISIP